MRIFFFKLYKNIIESFSGFNLIWHLAAIVITYLLVTSGFDWTYHKFFQASVIYPFFLVTTAVIGGLLPIVAPLIIYFVGKIYRDIKIRMTGLALGQAVIIGSVISSFYKAFTGRAHPELYTTAVVDISRVFKFGFFRGGIFWGWPSSHTTIAFAMALTLIMLFPKNKKVFYFSLFYAIFIGFGVSIGIHWFSDFVAGAIIGTIIGIVVGRSFYNHESTA